VGYDFYQTRCDKCNELLGEHWFYEEYSMFLSERDDSGGWGLKQDEKCSKCGGKAATKQVDRLERCDI